MFINPIMMKKKNLKYYDCSSLGGVHLPLYKCYGHIICAKNREQAREIMVENLREMGGKKNCRIEETSHCIKIIDYDWWEEIYYINEIKACKKVGEK